MARCTSAACFRVEADRGQLLISGDIKQLSAIATPSGLRGRSIRDLQARAWTWKRPATDSSAARFDESQPFAAW
jgi:hypothetical protein